MAPSQERAKAREIGIRCHPFAAVLDSEGGMNSISDDFALQISIFYETSENAPMARAGTNQRAERAVDQRINEPERLTDRRGRVEDPRVRDNS